MVFIQSLPFFWTLIPIVTTPPPPPPGFAQAHNPKFLKSSCSPQSLIMNWGFPPTKTLSFTLGASPNAQSLSFEVLLGLIFFPSPAPPEFGFFPPSTTKNLCASPPCAIFSWTPSQCAQNPILPVPPHQYPPPFFVPSPWVVCGLFVGVFFQGVWIGGVVPLCFVFFFLSTFIEDPHPVALC